MASRGRAQSSCWGQRVPDTALFPQLIQSHVPRRPWWPCQGLSEHSDSGERAGVLGSSPRGRVCFGLVFAREMGIACSFVSWGEQTKGARRRCPEPLLLCRESVLSCECLGMHRAKLLRRATDLGAGQVRTKDLHRTAQGGGRGLLQGVEEAGGSVLPAGKAQLWAAEEKVSPTLAVTHPVWWDPPACPGL